MRIFLRKVAPAADTRRSCLHRCLVVFDRIGNVVSRGEVAAIGAQNDDLDRFVTDGAAEGFIDFENHLRVDGVVLVSAGQHDAGDTFGGVFVTDGRFGHVGLSCWRIRRRFWH